MTDTPKGQHGGYREGAGRKPAPPEYLDVDQAYDDPLAFLEAVMNDKGAEAKHRIDAAKTLASYKHAKPGEKGKKELKDEDAKKIASKFAGRRSGLRAVQ